MVSASEASCIALMALSIVFFVAGTYAILGRGLVMPMVTGLGYEYVSPAVRRKLQKIYGVGLSVLGSIDTALILSMGFSIDTCVLVFVVSVLGLMILMLVSTMYGEKLAEMALISIPLDRAGEACPITPPNTSSMTVSLIAIAGAFVAVSAVLVPFLPSSVVVNFHLDGSPGSSVPSSVVYRDLIPLAASLIMASGALYALLTKKPEAFHRPINGRDAIRAASLTCNFLSTASLAVAESTFFITLYNVAPVMRVLTMAFMALTATLCTVTMFFAGAAIYTYFKILRAC